jgi:hypothetical protein
MKKITITAVTEENYKDVILRLINQFPGIKWNGYENIQLSTITFKAIVSRSKQMNPGRGFYGLSIDLEDFDLCYFSYEKNIYKENKKEEIALTTEQFLNQNVLDFPIKRFL